MFVLNAKNCTPYDINKIVIGEVKKQEFYLGSTKVTSCSSLITYDNKPIYIIGTEQSSLGVKAFYKIGENDKIPENIESYSLDYSTSSFGVDSSQTPGEKYIIKFFSDLYKKISIEFSDRKDNYIPNAAKNAIIAAKGKNGKLDVISNAAIKPILTDGFKKGPDGKWVTDKSQPKILKLQLESKGKGKSLKMFTKFFDLEQDSKEVCPTNYLSSKIKITPVIHLKHIWLGAHGSSSTYGLSVKLILAQANINVIDRTSTPQNNMLMDSGILFENMDSINNSDNTVVQNYSDDEGKKDDIIDDDEVPTKGEENVKSSKDEDVPDKKSKKEKKSKKDKKSKKEKE